MSFQWDEKKNQLNKAKHGFAFEEMSRFDWDLAVLYETEFVEFEARDIFIGPLVNGLVTVVTTERADVTRVISLRRASRAEQTYWKKEIQSV